MKFELKNVKHSAFASRETHCYEATLYIDGVRSYSVGNDGHGGSDFIHNIQGVIPKYTLPEIFEYFASLPEQTVDVGGGRSFNIQPSLDMHTSDLMNDWLLARDLKKRLKAGVLYTCKGDGNLYGAKFKQNGTKFSLEELLKSFREDDEIDKVLNKLPFDDALDVFKATAV